MDVNCFGESACLALALAGVVGAAAAEDDQVLAGKQVFERRCRTCHGGTATADVPIAAQSGHNPSRTQGCLA